MTPPPPKRNRTLMYAAVVLFALVVLAAVALVAYRVGAGSSQPAAITGPAPQPTCDVIGINGCTTKGADGGGAAVAPTKLAELSPVASSAPVPLPAAPSIDDGTWSVGQDFPAGTYRTTTAGADCYWAITQAGTNGEGIISNHVGGGHLTVNLRAGQDFETERCGTWTKA